ncbi:MAG: hypothetical protein PF485_04380 [Bacteroidales bacterium]|jgi:hypothetical protein|nr:hypothetical protein [Bacteroidales bacterium]
MYIKTDDISVNSWVVAHIKFGVIRQDSSPQSATIHSANVMSKAISVYGI